MAAPVVLITGALAGIGRATALAFARDGARVVVSGRRADAGQALAEELRNANARARYDALNVVGDRLNRLDAVVDEEHLAAAERVADVDRLAPALVEPGGPRHGLGVLGEDLIEPGGLLGGEQAVPNGAKKLIEFGRSIGLFVHERIPSEARARRTHSSNWSWTRFRDL